MAQNPEPSRLTCAELTALGLLGAVFAVGLFANWVSLAHALAAVGGFGAAVAIGWLWQRTAPEAGTAREELPETGDEPGEPR